MKVLITGGNGFIASHTIERAKAKGHEVYTNVREEHVDAEWLKDTHVYNIDVRDEAGMYALIEKVDGVINLAGLLGTKHVGDPQMYYDVNVLAVNKMIQACKEFGTTFIQIAVGNHFETNNYSNTKTAAEREVLKSCRYESLKGNVVRGLNAYGPRQKWHNTGKIIPTFCMKALKGEDLHVYGGKDNCGIMDMIWVGDLANILIDVLEKTYSGEHEPGQIFEAGTGVGMSVWDVAKDVVKLTKSVSIVREVPMRPGEGLRSVVVAQNPYEWDYRDWTDSLTETIAYYKDQV